MLAVAKDGAKVMKPARGKYQLHGLVSKMTARNRHEETDWGLQVGKEVRYNQRIRAAPAKNKETSYGHEGER